MLITILLLLLLLHLLLLLQLLLLHVVSILHLLLHGTHLFFKRVVLLAHHHHLLLIRAATLRTTTTVAHTRLASTGLELLLLYHILDEGALVHGDPMLLLELISIVVQESFIARHLISDREKADLVESLLGPHGLDREEELLRDVQYFFREVSPLAL